MARTFDLSGRGPSNRRLLVYGLGVILALLLVGALLVAKSQGRLENYVRVVASMNNIGDGLLNQSDVRFRGLLVGTTGAITPGLYGKPNVVNINLKGQFAGSIPGTVTARVVPSNVFAVSSVELVDNGNGPAIKPGASIPEDAKLPTIMFQTTINKLRDILYATARGREDKTLGVLAAIGDATRNRRVELLTAGAQVERIVNELDAIVATDTGPSTLSALIDATRGLQQTAPDLFDALHKAVVPMQTLVEQQAALNSLLDGGSHTLGTADTALANNIDTMTEIGAKMSPVLGVLAQQSHNFLPGFLKFEGLSNKFFDNVWKSDRDVLNIRIILSLAPFYTYTRADCPRYGELKGPSCFTAPLIAVRPDLPDIVLPQNFQPPPDLMPPPGTVVGPNGNLVAVGPPLINPNPDLTDHNPPLPPGWGGDQSITAPYAPVPGTANPVCGPQGCQCLWPCFAPPLPPGSPPPPPPPGPAAPPGQSYPAEVAAAPSSGEPATTVAQLMLGPDAAASAPLPAEAQPAEGRP